MQNELLLWVKKIWILLLISGILYISYLLSDVIINLLIAGFITILVNPLANLWEKYKIPAWLTVLWVYIVILLLWSIVIGTLIPIIVNYVTDTANLIIGWVNSAQAIYLKEGIAGFHFHPYIEKWIVLVFWEKNIEHTLDIIKQNIWNIQSILTSQISSITSSGISVVSTVGSVVWNWALIMITSFLMVLERREIWKFILDICPPKVDSYLRNHYYSIQKVCSSWIKATLVLSVSIFATTYIWLFLVEWIFDFSTEKRFTLALIGGIMEFIPYVWPLIALIPAVIIGLWISWKATLVLIILYFIIQRLENDILVPYVMSKALNLSPFLVFIVMIIGASIWGILWIILAVPIAGVAKVIFEDYRNRKNILAGEPLTKEKTKTTSKKVLTTEEK